MDHPPVLRDADGEVASVRAGRSAHRRGAGRPRPAIRRGPPRAPGSGNLRLGPAAAAAVVPPRAGSAVTSPMLPFTLRSARSEEHTSELQSLMRISYAVFCLKQTIHKTHHKNTQ